MKDIVKTIGLITLICFSFFYTEQVITVVNEQDPIMIKIKEEQDKYKVDVIEANIKDNSIIPGINGKVVDTEKSYNNMKELGMFKDSYLIYKEIPPSNSLSNVYDKYIVRGNPNKKAVSIVFTVTNENELNNILNNIDKSYNINIFIDYKTLSNNMDKIKKTKYNIYPYGEYTDDNLTLLNNLIKNNFNSSLYCLTSENKVIDECSNNKMHTIKPTNVLSNAYSEINKNLSSGNIILIENNNKNVKEFIYVYNNIYKKGLKIVNLEELLKETYQ